MNTTVSEPTIMAKSPAAEPLTIFHVLDYEPLGTRTMDEYVLRFIDGIRQRGWRASFAFAGEPSAEFRQELRKRDAGYIVVSFPLKWRSAWRIAKELRRRRPAILLTSFISPFNSRILALKMIGLAKRLVMIDQSSGAVSSKRGWRRRLARLRGWMAGRLVDRVLPVSDANARRDVQDVFLPARKVQRIYNGIVLERFNPVVQRAPGPPRIVYVGQLIPEKGILTLLKAFRQLPADVELTIAGRGRQEAELREFCRASALDRVRFVGHIAAVAELFAGADVVVVPSEWEEAFGFVAAEAMACGAAVIVSDAGGLPEVVGEAGLVFRRGDALDLEVKLRQLIDAPEIRLELSRRARERAVEMFSLDCCITNHLAVLATMSQ
jgi:glycosyltransferase involved in cell wall biosynthesis